MENNAAFNDEGPVADEPFVVPRALATANIKLCGVLLAYATEDLADLVKSTMGWNFVRPSRRADHGRDRRPRRARRRTGRGGHVVERAGLEPDHRHLRDKTDRIDDS